MLKTVINFSVLLVFVLISSSCYNTKKNSYFNEVQDATILARANEMQINVQKNDLLSITISSANSVADVPFNVSNSVKASNLTSSGNRNETSGYLVDVDGNIEINQLGKIKAAGLTKKQQHPINLKPRHEVYLNIDLKQRGVGGDNSWGALPHQQYRLLDDKYTYSFIVRLVGTH